MQKLRINLSNSPILSVLNDRKIYVSGVRLSLAIVRRSVVKNSNFSSPISAKDKENR